MSAAWVLFLLLTPPGHTSVAGLFLLLTAASGCLLPLLASPPCRQVSPVTGVPLPHSMLAPNHGVKASLLDFLRFRAQMQ